MTDTPSPDAFWDRIRAKHRDQSRATLDEADAPSAEPGPGANAEDCPQCRASTRELPYPWMCPGHSTAETEALLAGKEEDFYEDDQPVEQVIAAFEAGEKTVTRPPDTPPDLDEIRDRHTTYVNRHAPRPFTCCSAHASADDVPALLAEIEQVRAHAGRGLRNAFVEGAVTYADYAHGDLIKERNAVREENQQLRAALDSAYRERAHLTAHLAVAYPAVLVEHAPDEPGYALLYVTVDGRQMSWHINHRDLPLYGHVERVDVDDPRAQWDGHTTEQKYRQLDEHTRALAEEAELHRAAYFEAAREFDIAKAYGAHIAGEHGYLFGVTREAPTQVDTEEPTP